VETHVGLVRHGRGRESSRLGDRTCPDAVSRTDQSFGRKSVKCRAMLADVAKQMKAIKNGPGNLGIAIEYLSEVLTYETGQMETMRLAVQGVRQATYLASWTSRAGQASD
jgi:hypothetical protein